MAVLERAQRRSWPVRLLVTSVGSLVGQNVLDMLEGRRDQVHLIGTTDDAANPRLYRCDTVYIVPPTADGAVFEAKLRQIIERERVELVIAARDPDILVQAGWRGTHPELVPILTAGRIEPAEIMQDKLLSYKFAAAHGLPFAPTAVCSPGGDLDPVLELAERVGFPLVAKPRGGYGSIGAALVLDQEQLEAFRGETGFVFQQHLDPPQDLEGFLRPLRRGIPLFFSLPERSVYGCQVIMGPDGRVDDIFGLRVSMVMGRSEYHKRVDEPELEALGRRYAESLAAIGWVGPLNIQCKRRRDGGFTVFELNGRLSGGSSARMRLGSDEMATLVHLFVGPGRLARVPRPPPTQRRVIKTLVDGALDDADVDRLEKTGVWHRSE